MRKLGIDVSYHQGAIDWAKVKAAGIEFAIIRAGYGRSTVDSQFHNNVKGCIDNDIPFGTYWFIYGINEQESIQNADKFHETIAPYKDKITMGAWCDHEYDTDNNAQRRGVTLTKSMRTAMVVTFCERMKSYGYEVGNYANRDYMRTKFNDLSQYPLWYARYGVTEATMRSEYNPLMWQYTSDGSVPGIYGKCDMNYYYGELPERKPEYYESPEFTLIDSLNKIGVDSSYANRKRIAEKNGIGNPYTGTAQQNIDMLRMLCEGTLIKA